MYYRGLYQDVSWFVGWFPSKTSRLQRLHSPGRITQTLAQGQTAVCGPPMWYVDQAMWSHVILESALLLYNGCLALTPSSWLFDLTYHPKTKVVWRTAAFCRDFLLFLSAETMCPWRHGARTSSPSSDSVWPAKKKQDAVAALQVKEQHTFCWFNIFNIIMENHHV